MRFRIGSDKSTFGMIDGTSLTQNICICLSYSPLYLLFLDLK